MDLQQTIAHEVNFSGQALHNGKITAVRVIPQPEHTGILFRRADLAGASPIKAEVAAVIDTRRCVTLGKDGWRIATIEHLMAAFHGLGIDNALVEVSGEELPAGDGSSLYFANQLLAAGIKRLAAPRDYVVINQPLWVEEPISGTSETEKASLIILPADRFEISCVFQAPHPVIGSQYFFTTLSPDVFINEIAPARTFAFLEELPQLRSQGLALCDDYGCAVVIGATGYVNELRFVNEIVRHKILDIIGDLYLAGPVIGHVIAIRPGHNLDIQLARKIIESHTEME